MHFFIDHTEVSNQVDIGTDPDMKFGPDATNPTTKFNITTQHQLTNVAKAFACQDGMMIVQKNDNDPANLVNVIIKPLKPTMVKGFSVRYYVYRGININSFFTLSSGVYSIIANGTANNSEFLTVFWENQATLQAEDPNYVAPTVLNLGYGADTLPLTDPNNLNENRSIDDIFDNKAPTKAVNVKEGLWIGNFSDNSKIGFDIVLESELKIPSELKLFRAATRSVETGVLAGKALKRRKEEILAFIDPAAFFGLHYKDRVTGVNTTAYTGNVKGNTTNRTTPGSLYPQIIEKYTNKNRVYVDVRSERGLSYNFYENYRISEANLNNIRLGGVNEGEATLYGTDEWPIEIITTTTSAGTTSRKNKFSIRLRRDGNTDPVLFMEDKNYSHRMDGSRNRKYFYEGNDILENGVANWTKNITIYYPDNNESDNNNLATHIKFYYYINAPVTDGTDRMHTAKYYDAAFCPLDLSSLGDTAVTNGWVESPNAIFIKEALQTDGTGNFSFVARSGVYWDTQKVLFYASSLDIKNKSSGKVYINTFTKKLSMANAKYITLKNKFEIINRQYQRLISGVNTDFNILGINDYKVRTKHKEKEDLLLLGITPAELQTLNNVTGLSDLHPKYIFLSPEANNPQYDTTTLHHRYHQYTIHVQGLDAAGVSQRIASTVVVFSRDNVFFSSSDFAALETLSDGLADFNASQQNRLEYHIYDAGVIRINDNIDIALLRKSTIVDEHTVTPDTAIVSDQSIAQQIHFLWHPVAIADTPVVAPTAIVSFNIVMANKMKRPRTRGGRVNSIPIPEYVLTLSYTLGNALRTYTSGTDGDIISSNRTTLTGGTKKKYENQNKKVFLVHFVTALTTTTNNNVFDVTNNTLGIVFTFSNSRRRYVDLPFCAAVLGALIRDGKALTSTGFGFGDGSSYPSAEHVNGTALDNSYFRQPAGTWQNDVDFMTELDHFGIKLFRTGMNTSELNTNLANEPFSNKVLIDTDAFIIYTNPVTGATKSLHDSHLHSAYVKLNEV